jgi:hypothetical protein
VEEIPPADCIVNARFYLVAYSLLPGTLWKLKFFSEKIHICKKQLNVVGKRSVFRLQTGPVYPEQGLEVRGSFSALQNSAKVRYAMVSLRFSPSPSLDCFSNLRRATLYRSPSSS